MAVKNVEKETISIMPTKVEYMRVTIQGISPLITHAWSAKAKREMLAKQVKATKTKGHEIKNPYADFASSMYWLTPMPESMAEDSIREYINDGARFGFPLTAIKQAACSAVYRAGIVKNQMGMRGAFFIEPSQGYYYGGEVDLSSKTLDIIPNMRHLGDMVEIICPDGPEMREDNVRVGMGSADIRYRAQFTDWEMTLDITYNANGDITAEQIVNAINLGGFAVGIGEWRPEKDGSYGRFRVKA